MEHRLQADKEHKKVVEYKQELQMLGLGSMSMAGDRRVKEHSLREPDRMVHKNTGAGRSSLGLLASQVQGVLLRGMSELGRSSE
jgi:hypothetical protein